MEGDIPTPLVNRLPLKIGLYFEPALVQYVFEEKIQDHGDWRVDIGSMQPKLFRKIATAMFVESVQVDSITPPGRLRVASSRSSASTAGEVSVMP